IPSKLDRNLRLKLEDRTPGAAQVPWSRAVEITRGVSDQASVGLLPVGPVFKFVERSFFTGRVQLEYDAATVASVAGENSSRVCRSVQVAGCILDQSAVGKSAVRTQLKLVEHGLFAGLIQLKYGAAPARQVSTPFGGSVKVAGR